MDPAREHLLAARVVAGSRRTRGGGAALRRRLRAMGALLAACTAVQPAGAAGWLSAAQRAEDRAARWLPARGPRGAGALCRAAPGPAGLAAAGVSLAVAAHAARRPAVWRPSASGRLRPHQRALVHWLAL